MFGEKLRELREGKGLFQRQVASELDVDTAYISKLENSEKPVSRAYLKKLAVLLCCPEEELLTLWLADKIYELAKGEAVALKAIEVAKQAIVDQSIHNPL